MKILFLSNASLTSGFIVGSHQLARQYILQGHDVIHVSSPVSILNILKGRIGLKKLYQSLFGKNTHTHWGFFDLIPFVPFPYGYFGFLDKIDDFFIKQTIKKYNKVGFDLVLVDQPLFHGVIKYLDSKKIVYRPTDIYSDMGGERFNLAEKKIIPLASVIIATNKIVLEKLSLKNSIKSFVIENGVDSEFFSSGKSYTEQRQGCVYIGAIDFRFDHEVLVRLAEKYSDIKFDIYGPCVIDVDNKIPNLNYYGQLSYFELPSMLKKYKVGLLPLNNHPANSGRSPMKLWEYYSSNLLVLRRGFGNKPLGPWDIIYNDCNDVFSSFEKAYFGEDSELILSQTTRKDFSWDYISKEIISITVNDD